MRPRPKPRQPKPARAPERTFAVRGDHITLGQLLKFVGTIGTGGEAKYYLAETVVQVNGEPEQRRGRKLRPGDLVVPPGEAAIRLTAYTGAADEVEDEDPATGEAETGDAETGAQESGEAENDGHEKPEDRA